MIDSQTLTRAVSKLGMLKFFPSDAGTREAISVLLDDICSDEQRLAWLVTRALNVFNEWPGPGELRALYCSRYKPADGIESTSTIHPEGDYPPDPTAPARLTAAQPLRLAAGTKDPELSALISLAAERKKL